MNIYTNTSNKKGFSLVELLIVVTIIGIISAIAVPNLLQARRTSNEASAVSSLSIIYRSQLAYKMAEGNGEFTDLTTLHEKHYIDETLGSGLNIKSGYKFETQIFQSTPTTYARANIRARPIVHAQVNAVTATGSRHFGVTEVGGIYSTSDNTSVTFDDDTRLATGTAVPIDGN